MNRRRLIFKVVSFIQFPLGGLCIYLGKKKHDRFFDLVPLILIVTLCVNYGITNEFSAKEPSEFLQTATIVVMLSSLLLAVFATNGIFDILIGLLAPTFTVMISFKQENFVEGETSLILPATLMTLLGCFCFNYLVCEI